MGDEHGGAGSNCMEMIAAGVARARPSVSGRRRGRAHVRGGAGAARARCPAWATACTRTDPRTPVLFDLARPAGLAGDGIAFMGRSQARPRERGQPLPINIDGALAAVLHDLGFPPPFGRLVFLIGRVAGLTAEVAEELRARRPCASGFR